MLNNSYGVMLSCEFNSKTSINLKKKLCVVYNDFFNFIYDNVYSC